MDARAYMANTGGSRYFVTGTVAMVEGPRQPRAFCRAFCLLLTHYPCVCPCSGHRPTYAQLPLVELAAGV